MKTPYVILVTGIIVLSICLAFTFGNSSNRTNIKITETPWLFKLEASYNAAESKNVEDYFNQSLKTRNGICRYRGCRQADNPCR